MKLRLQTSQKLRRHYATPKSVVPKKSVGNDRLPKKGTWRKKTPHGYIRLKGGEI